MPTIMSQNLVRPEDYKPDTLIASDMSSSAMDSRGNGRILKDSIASDSSQVATISVVVTKPSKPIHTTPSFGAKHHPKLRPLAIQTTSLHTLGKYSDNNNSKNHPNAATTEQTSSSTTATSAVVTSPPSSTASSTASSSTNSPMSHIRRWTSSLSSSKSNTKGSGKVRTIGPISAPQPLTTPVPYACTPLPYSDLPYPDHFPVSPASLLAGHHQSGPRSSPYFGSTTPRSSTKPAATSCPDFPISPQASGYSNASTPIGTYSSLSRNQRTSWKGRLFNSNTTKKQERCASTNSNVDDEYEWSSNQETDASSSSASTSSSSTTRPTSSGASPSTEKPTRPRIRISPPLTQPVLPANQKTAPIMQNTLLLSPTDDLPGPDMFDPFNMAPKSISPSSSMTMMLTVASADDEVLPSANSSSSSVQGSGRMTINTHIRSVATPIHQLLTPPSSRSPEDSFPFSSPSPTSPINENTNVSTSTAVSEDKAEVAVIDFAASLCEGLGSDFVMPPSYFDQHNLNIAFEDAYPRPVPEMMSKAAVPSPPSSPPSPRSLGSPRSIRGQVSLNDRSSKSSSIYSTDSDSSVSLTDSDSSDSDSDSDSDSSLSPVSGASFFSSVPTTPAPTPVPMPASVPKSSNFSAALMKSGGIKIPSSLMTLLPSGSTKSKTIPASPSTTPPVSPPLAHVEAVTKQMANGPFGRPPPGVVTGLADPRAMIVKRLAYIHTLRKLREREKRPFRHAVLLHLVLLQLRRGLTNRHCGEVAEFYVAMSATQFPPRLEIASAMMMAQQQRTKLQQQQQMLSQPLLSQIPVPSPASSTIESVQESMIPVRSSSKTTPIPVTGTSGDKGPKSKRSLVFSLQSRKAQNSTAGSSSNNESGWSFTSPSSAAATTSIPPSQISAFKDRLPLLQIPTYPLINLEKNTSNSVLTSLPIRKSLAAATYSSDDDHGIEDGNVDFQPGMVQPAPTVILPKKTTGRKGLLYQQQLQLRMRQQMPTMMGGNSGAGQMPLAPGMTEQDLMLLQSQLTGARPRFATSTFTTVRTGRSEVVTRPLVTVASVKVSPAIKATIPADIPSSSSWNSFPFGSFSHRSYQNGATATATSATTMTTSAATTSASQDGNGSLPAGLLTPPLSPLFRNPFSTVTPSPTATTATMPLATTMGSVKSSDTLSYNSNTTINAPSNFNSSIPPPLPPSATPTTNANISMRSSYAVQGQHSPTSSHHIRGTSAGVVSSFKLPHIQNSHHTISYLEGQAVHARSRNVNETTGLHHPFPLTRKVSGGILTHKQIQHQLHPGLPSPPLSPTLDTEGNATAMVSTGSARHSLPQRSLLSSGYAHVHHGHGVVMPSSGVNNINSNGGRSENIAWITRSPSPGSQHEIQSRQSMEDMRSRRQWRISLPSPPLPASAIAAAPVPVGRMSMKKKSSSSKGGAFIPGVGGGEESEEEDVPLAFVQRRISSETLRLLA